MEVRINLTKEEVVKLYEVVGEILRTTSQRKLHRIMEKLRNQLGKKVDEIRDEKQGGMKIL